MTREVELEWRKAQRKRDEASSLSAATTPDALISTSYYAIYHAAIAALLSANGSSPTKHGKVHQALVRLAESHADEDFADELSFAVDQAYRMRIRSDYEPDARPEETRVNAERIGALRDKVIAFCERVIERG